jgi:hypothetical protein
LIQIKAGYREGIIFIQRPSLSSAMRERAYVAAKVTVEYGASIHFVFPPDDGLDIPGPAFIISAMINLSWDF